MNLTGKICNFILLLFVVLNAQQSDLNKTVTVKYISADYIYIDGGREDGIAIGDTLSILNNRKESVLLKVIYISDHSAS